MITNAYGLIWVMALVFGIPATWAQEPSSGISQTEVDSANGEASEPKKKVSPGLYYLIDANRNFQGGTARGNAFLGAVVNGLNFDLGEIFKNAEGLQDTHFYIDHFVAWGSQTSGKTGDIQLAINSWAPSTNRIYQAWIEKELNFQNGSSFSIKLGSQDMNWEFQSTESSLFLLNSSFSLSPEFLFSGKQGPDFPIGPSTFPFTSLGARASFSPNEQFKFMAGVFDGVPANPNDLGKFSWALNSEEGFMGMFEATFNGKIRKLPTRISLGAWGYSNVGGTGAYLLIEQRIYEPRLGGSRGLTFFSRLGTRLDDENVTIDRSLATGLTYTGIFPKRAEDKLTAAIAIARSGSMLRLKAQEELATIQNFETAYELAYRAKIIDSVFLQPDFQVISSPSFSADVATAISGGVRLEVNL